MKKIQISKREFIIAALALLIGIIISAIPGRNNNYKDKTEEHAHLNEASIWTCSMHPQIRLEKEGDCPICGMDLIAISENTQKTSPNALSISEEAKALLNLQTYKMSYRLPISEIELTGKIETNSSKNYHLSANYSGRIEELYANYAGKTIKKGEKIALIYSPELIEAQQELFEAAKLKTSHSAFYQSVVSKLMLWGLSASQIENMQKSGKLNPRFELLSPTSGTIENLAINAGNYINKGQMLMSIADLSTVWLHLDAYENDLPYLQINQEVDFSIKAFSGTQFSGKVSFIEPFVNSKNRTSIVRIEVKNAQFQLKPGMVVSARLQHQNKSELQLMLPKSALLFAGNRYVVYVKDTKAEGLAFLYREIIPGAENSQFVWVKEGLQEGEEVLINSVFKVDAAAQLAGLPSLMNPPLRHSDLQSDASKFMLSHLSQITSIYLELQNALSKDSLLLANALSNKIRNVMLKLNTLNLQTEERMYYEIVLSDIDKKLSNPAPKQNIMELREDFYEISELIIKLNYRYKQNEIPLYLAYCPMANNSAGAYWLSRDKIIANPYFGKSMLRCGEVRDSLPIY